MLRIRLNDPQVLDELRVALAEAECSTARVDETTLLVTDPLDVDEREVRLEVAFYLKAWQSAHPEVELELLS